MSNNKLDKEQLAELIQDLKESHQIYLEKTARGEKEYKADLDEAFIDEISDLEKELREFSV